MRPFILLFALTIIFLVTLNPTLAQTEKGNHLTGVQVGNIVLSRRENLGSAVQLKPTYGYFIGDNLAVGVSLPFYYYTNKGVNGYRATATQLGVTPLIRYYVGSGLIKPFVNASAGIRRTEVRENSTKVFSNNAFLYGVGLGAAYFVNNSVSFDLGVNYTDSKNQEDTFDATNVNALTPGLAGAVNITLGFQVFFGGR